MVKPLVVVRRDWSLARCHHHNLAMKEYGIVGNISDSEEDHLIPLQFRGNLISTESLKRGQM
jgi:hypothetical protein